MIWLPLTALAMAWVPGQPAAAPNWKATADKIAPLMAGFHPERGTSSERYIKFLKVLNQVGVRATYDEGEHKQKPGYYILSHDTVIPVRGSTGGALVFLHYTTEKPEYMPMDSALIAFVPTGSTMRGCLLKSWSGASYSSVNPAQAAIAGKLIAVWGLYAWMGNGPQVSAMAFQKTGNGWEFLAQKTAPFESWGATKLEPNREGTRIMPIRFESRTYPKFVQACHATAQLTYEEKWSFPNGRPHLDWKKQRDTAYNALDPLYDAIKRGDKTAIRSRSASSAIARQIIALHKRALEGEPYVQFPGSYCDGDATVLGVENLRKTFHFARRKGKWVVVRLGPLSESD